jgi:2-hydroxychromene-2-carboxylate isomerase
MTPEIDFYFDYLSPYAYLAWRKLPEITEARGVTIRPKPVLFAGLLNHWGQLGPAEIPPKATHVFKECARFAQLAGIPFRSPRYHPFKPLTALRVSLAEVSGPDQSRVIGAIFDAGWALGQDLGDAIVIRNALNGLDLDGEALVHQASEPDVKNILHENTLAAVEKGVFGIPTMIANQELFWGLDQLAYLALFLDGKDPLANVDPQAINSQGPAAVRPGSLNRGPARG